MISMAALDRYVPVIDTNLSRRARTLWTAWTVYLLAMVPALATEIPPAGHRGIVHLARLFDPKTLDPSVAEMQEDFILLPLLYLPLLDEVGGTNIIPCAAKAWRTSDDRRIYTLELRPEIRFSNGRPVRAVDYIYTIERTVDPATAASLASYLGGIRGVEDFKNGRTNHIAGLSAPDPLTLIVELDKPDPTFQFILASNLTMPVDSQEVARVGKFSGTAPSGTGPYILKRWIRGALLELVANPAYTGPEPQRLDGIDFLIGGDETTELMMFERGSLDVANIAAVGIPSASLRRMKENPVWAKLLQSTPGLNTTFISLNTEIPPLDQVLVRRAINFAIQRDKWMKVSLGVNSHSEGPTPPAVAGYDPELHGYTSDPERARHLLRESGVKLPLKLTLWHPIDDNNRFIAQGIQGDLRLVDIELDLKAVNYGELITAIQTRGRIPMSLSGWNATIPDPVDMLGTQFDGRSVTNPATVNFSFYNNPAVNQLLDEAAPEVDLKARYARYRKAERIILADAPWVCLGHLNILGLPQPWLKGPLMDPIYWYRFDRVWIER